MKVGQRSAFRERFDMHIIAIASSFATTINILLAFSIEEISHRRKNSRYLLPSKEPSIDVVQSILRIILVSIFDIDIPHNVITQVINNNHIFNLAVLTHFLEHLLEEGLKPKLINNYFVSAFSASSSVTTLPEIIAVSTALFSYICSSNTV